MKSIIASFMLIFSVSSSHAVGVEDIDWESQLSAFTTARQYKFAEINKEDECPKGNEAEFLRTRTVRYFARHVCESYFQANYRGSKTIFVPYNDYGFGLTVFKFQGEKLLDLMQTHFKKELEGFELNDHYFNLHHSISGFLPKKVNDLKDDDKSKTKEELTSE